MESSASKIQIPWEADKLFGSEGGRAEAGGSITRSPDKTQDFVYLRHLGRTKTVHQCFLFESREHLHTKLVVAIHDPKPPMKGEFNVTIVFCFLPLSLSQTGSLTSIIMLSSSPAIARFSTFHNGKTAMPVEITYLTIRNCRCSAVAARRLWLPSSDRGPVRTLLYCAEFDLLV